MTYFTGIDIGSTSAKTIVMDEQKQICMKLLQPTGWSSVDTANEILQKLEDAGIKREDSRIVATGYGRVSVPFADKCVTEITCHGMGACFLYEEKNLTIVDIGGQDTKVIQTLDGQVTDFVMNDKCSAGTGRFLEVMANTLSVRPDELCALAARGGGTSISSMCTVFAESEVISLIGQGQSRENIAYAVVDSIVNKVAAQAGRLSIQSSMVCLTGGLCGMSYLTEALSKVLGVPVQTTEEGRYAGAVGAALKAMQI